MKTNGRVFIGPPDADPLSLDGLTDIGRFATDGMITVADEPAPMLATGNYRPCTTCHAPIVDPFPQDWSIDLIKEGPPEGPVETFTTPHRPCCGSTANNPATWPTPGIAVNIPGQYIAEVGTPFDAYIEAYRAAVEARRSDV